MSNVAWKSRFVAAERDQQRVERVVETGVAREQWLAGDGGYPGNWVCSVGQALFSLPMRQSSVLTHTYSGTFYRLQSILKVGYLHNTGKPVHRGCTGNTSQH